MVPVSTGFWYGSVTTNNKLHKGRTFLIAFGLYGLFFYATQHHLERRNPFPFSNGSVCDKRSVFVQSPHRRCAASRSTSPPPGSPGSSGLCFFSSVNCEYKVGRGAADPHQLADHNTTRLPVSVARVPGTDRLIETCAPCRRAKAPLVSIRPIQASLVSHLDILIWAFLTQSWWMDVLLREDYLSPRLGRGCF
jgi:hypothetical protein